MNYQKAVSAILILLFSTHAYTQKLAWSIDEDDDKEVSLTFLNQTWLRYTEMNPGSRIYGEDVSDKLDIGLRRTRFIIDAQIHPRVYVFTQFGINNFDFRSERKSQFFIHDAWADYEIVPEKFALGGGLTPFSGYARYSTPAVASILGLDAPLFQQSTGDVNDQFLRGLSVYAKGRIARVNYHLAMTDPFSLQNTNLNPEIASNTRYSFKLPNKVYQGYFYYQFKDFESWKSPYMAGSYLGKLDVFNIGAGFKYQQEAMWRLENNDTLSEDMILFAIDLFYEKVLNKDKGNVFTIYTGYFNTTFGKNYVQNVGVMNPANGIDPQSSSFNGPGNSFPMRGSGNTLYLQSAYLISNSLSLQPYVTFNYSDFVLLNSAVTVYEGGLNYFIMGHNAKISLGAQMRPVVDVESLKESSHKGMYVIQMQVKI